MTTIRQVAGATTQKDIEAAIADPSRLHALSTSGLLDLPASDAFDRLTRIASRATDSPAAFFSLIDVDRTFYLSQVGLQEPLASSRALSEQTLCQFGLVNEGPLVINDTQADEVFKGIASVRSLGVRAYVGVPVTAPGGERLGSLCVIDYKPRAWTDKDVEIISEMAAATTAEVRLRIALGQSEQAREQLQEEAVRFNALKLQSETQVAELKAQLDSINFELDEARRFYLKVVDAIPSMVGYWDTGLCSRFANKAYSTFFGKKPEEILGKTLRDLLGEELYQKNLPMAQRALQGETLKFEREIPRPDGSGSAHSLAHYIPDVQGGEVKGFFVLVHDVTEIHEANRRLQSEKRLTETLYRRTPSIMHSLDAQGNILTVSDLWLQRLGYSEEAVIGRPIFSFMSQAQADLARATISPALTKYGYLRNQPISFRSQTGEEIEFELSSEVMPEGTGPIVLSTLVDVTERNAAIRSQKFHSTLLEDIIESLPYGIVVVDQLHNIYLKNKKFGENLRLPPSLIQKSGLNFSEYVRYLYARGDYGSANSVEEILHHFAEQMVNRSAFTLQRKQFDNSYLEFKAVPISNGWTSVTYLDITEKVTSEQKAKANYELMVSALESIDEAFVMYDEKDCLVFCNGSYRNLFAKNPEDLGFGNSFEDNVRRGLELGVYSGVSGAIADIEAFVAQRVALHQSGNHTAVTQLGDGRVMRVIDRTLPNGYIVGFRIDVTELTRAKVDAEQAANAKGQFLANMSHEIRTPMNAILGMLNLLQRTELTQRQRDYASKSEAAAQSLLGLLNDILDFSKVDAGKMVLESLPFRFDSLFRKLSVVLAANIQSKDIEVLFDLDPNLPEVVMGDALRLQQILINLGGNGVKFTEHGQVVISVKRSSSDDKAARIAFSVEDSGIGIAADHQAHIFTGFSQAEGSTTRRFGGTGLGLAISKSLVELMGGSLLMESTLGLGTTFSFEIEFPVAQNVPEDLRIPTRSQSIRQDVLIVDNNPVAGRLLLKMVQAMGWQGEWVASGQAALDAVRQKSDARGDKFPYSVILMDWEMPQMDGWQTTQAIREIARTSPGETPLIIMVSANGRQALRSEDRQDLVNGFLLKTGDGFHDSGRRDGCQCR